MKGKEKRNQDLKKKPTTIPNNLEKIYIHIWIEYSSIRCTVIILQPKTAICTRSVKKWGKKNDSFSQNFLFGFDLLEIPLSISFSKTQQYLLPVLSDGSVCFSVLWTSIVNIVGMWGAGGEWGKLISNFLSYYRFPKPKTQNRLIDSSLKALSISKFVFHEASCRRHNAPKITQNM